MHTEINAQRTVIYAQGKARERRTSVQNKGCMQRKQESGAGRLRCGDRDRMRGKVRLIATAAPWCLFASTSRRIVAGVWGRHWGRMCR